MRRNLASKVEQEPLSFEGVGRARPFRSSILLVSRSCGVFPLREPTGIGHQNLLPVPIPSTLKSVVTRIVSRSYHQCFPDLQDPRQDQHSHYICIQRISSHQILFGLVPMKCVEVNTCHAYLPKSMRPTVS